MKQTFFTLLLLSAIGLTSCHKSSTSNLNINQYDLSQIQNYIAKNNITGMVRDTLGGDTSGIYYQIIHPGSGASLADTSTISFCFSLKSFDGLYTSVDTIYNQYYGFLGHLTTDALPLGLQYAILNDLKQDGGTMRVLIPSRLAYGVNGYGTGSVHAAGRIAGNQCLDYYVHLVSPAQRPAYDDLVIQTYMKANNLTGYTKTSVTIPPVGYGVTPGEHGTYSMYYKVIHPGTGTDSITVNSTFTATYTGELLDNTNFDYTYNGTDTASLTYPTLTLGEQGAIKHVTAGSTLSMIFPSTLGYGNVGITGVPSNSCLRYEYKIYTVTP
jgi:FKBP-type peptidyl-prolyl cis-trans isomerase FkpA